MRTMLEELVVGMSAASGAGPIWAHPTLPDPSGPIAQPYRHNNVLIHDTSAMEAGPIWAHPSGPCGPSSLPSYAGWAGIFHTLLYWMSWCLVVLNPPILDGLVEGRSHLVRGLRGARAGTRTTSNARADMYIHMRPTPGHSLPAH